MLHWTICKKQMSSIELEVTCIKWSHDIKHYIFNPIVYTKDQVRNATHWDPFPRGRGNSRLISTRHFAKFLAVGLGGIRTSHFTLPQNWAGVIKTFATACSCHQGHRHFFPLIGFVVQSCLAWFHFNFAEKQQFLGSPSTIISNYSHRKSVIRVWWLRMVGF